MTVDPQDYNGAEKFLLPSDIIAHYFKWFVKDEEVTKINKVVVEMTNNFNLGVDEDDIEEHLAVAPEKLNMEKLLELEQECIAKEEAREKKKKTP